MFEDLVHDDAVKTVVWHGNFIVIEIADQRLDSVIFNEAVGVFRGDQINCHHLVSIHQREGQKERQSANFQYLLPILEEPGGVVQIETQASPVVVVVPSEVLGEELKWNEFVAVSID
jgi:hypothetical protein